MVTNKAPMIVLSWIVGSGLAWAQDDAEATPELVEETPSVTEHEITVNGDTLRYDVTTGKLPIKTDTGEEESLAKVKTDITSCYSGTKSMGERGEANVPGAR